MSQQYREMWKDLGLDLVAHDALLGVLGQGYQDIFLSQTNRPQGMDYFNFVVSEIHGLRIKELSEARNQGRKVVGSFCVFVPEEIVLAANGICVGLCAGADFATDEVEKLLPRNTCALIKSALGFKLGRVCPYLESADLVVGENTCDGKKKSYETFGTLVKRLYVMDMPQMKSKEGKELLKAEYWRFIREMEDLTNVRIEPELLGNAIKTVNAKREAVHRLSKLRSADPAPISGLDALLINQVYFYDDPVRFTASVNQICDEIEERIASRNGVFPEATPRILLSGCPMAVPNWKIPWLIESSGAVIVGEESCIGERGSRNLVDCSSDNLEGMVDAMVDRYFKIDCAVYTPNPDRLAHIKSMKSDYRADGVIHYGLQFCQPYQMESIPVEKALEDESIPTLRIDTDYSMEDLGQLKTRIEAFIERIK